MILLALPFLFSGHLSAQQYALDSTFGTNGIVTTHFPGPSHIISILVQPDHKIVVCGHIYETGGHRIGIVRYMPDGSLDVNFGSGGKILFNYDVITSDKSYIKMVDGDKLLVLGTSRKVLETQNRFFFAKFNNDGTPDLTFGNDGILALYGTGYAMGLEILDDGKILAVGNFGPNVNIDMGLLRLNPDGNFDQTFGTGGKVSLNFGIPGNPAVISNDGTFCYKILPDGKMLVGGFSNSSNQYEQFNFAMARLNYDGSFDTTFGNQGRTITAFGQHTQINSMLINDQDEIFALGEFYNSVPQEGKVALAKYDSDGHADLTFGDAGKKIITITTQAYGFLTRAMMTQEGKILGSGTTGNSFWENQSTPLVQLNQDGSFDTDFPTDGISMFDLHPSANDGMMTMVEDPDGKILMGGYINSDFGLVRLYRQTLGVSNNISSDAFAVYPNPSKDWLHFQIPAQVHVERVTVSDLTGKLVVDAPMQDQLDVRHLQQGVYIVRLFSGEKTHQLKFIKQ